jgi:hypothetical protein
VLDCSGLHLAQGRNPAARASRADSNVRCWSLPVLLGEQPGRQKMPVAVLATRTAWSCFKVSDAMVIFACIKLPNALQKRIGQTKFYAWPSFWL